MKSFSSVVSISSLLVFSLVALPSNVIAANAADCSCGFYDAATKNVFTDHTIVYFNETTELPAEAVVAQTFEDRYDRGWNTIYRKGANVSNVEITNDTSAKDFQSLALYCDPSTPEHLVVGGSVRTTRQDHFYGSFRTLMRSPRKWFPGSILSMFLHHNQTQSWEMNLMNTNHHANAWVSMLAGGVFPNLWLGVNYTTLQAAGMRPWIYTEYRVDWTPDSIEYYIGGELQRSMTKKLNGTLPATPAALQWQHYSTGDVYASQGPPVQRGVANVAAIRLFFNSSTTTKEQQEAFDARCQPSLACSMDDWTLRGSSPYTEEASEEWVQKQPHEKTKWIPIIVDIAFGFLSTILLAKTINRRTSWSKVLRKLTFRKGDDVPRSDSPQDIGATSPTSSGASPRPSGSSSPTLHSGTTTPAVYAHEKHNPNGAYNLATYPASTAPTLVSGMNTPASRFQSPNASSSNMHGQFVATGIRTPAPMYQSPSASRHDVAQQFRFPVPPSHHDAIEANHDARQHSGPHRDGYLYSSDVNNPFLSEDERTAIASTVDPSRAVRTIDPIEPTAPLKASSSLPPPNKPLLTILEEKRASQIKTVAVVTTEGAKAAESAVTIPTKRVDYLAGFIAISAILVTMNHFGLTYWAAVIIPSTDPHYPSEITARKSIGSYFLDPLWIGPFLMISTRFLVSGYLRNGKLDAMAQRITSRPFRLLIPVAFIAILEYFFMDLGATHWLEYLPSVTWSSWPYTTIPTNAGTFISQVLQLAYLIPNAAPQITYYYCTGVLWTIPVQLQGAWQTILAVIMIREIKTPWKRFAFYAFCILNHWYALSWGSYYYSGVLLADLDLTYKYTKYLHARPLVYFPFLVFVCLVAQSGFTIDLVTQHTGVNYAQFEYGVHPDVATGLTISQAGRSTYPDYFIPRLNGLISTVFMQLIVEICPTVQRFLSLKLFQWIFPHVFTIYLIHGFIFWSIGSAVCVALFTHGLPYWACVLIVAIVCYGTLFVSMPILTPVIEIVGKNVTQSIWEHASQEPAPRQKTLFPFGPDVFEEGGETVGRDPTLMEKELGLDGEGKKNAAMMDVIEVVPTMTEKPSRNKKSAAVNVSEVSGNVL